MNFKIIMQFTTDQKDINLQRLRMGINTIIIFLTACFMVPIFFRTDLDLPTSYYATLGWVTFSIIGSLAAITLSGFLSNFPKRSKNFVSLAIATLYSVYPATAIVIGIYIIGLLLDPWLLISTFARAFIWIGGLYIILMPITFLIFRKRLNSEQIKEPSQELDYSTLIAKKYFTPVVLGIFFILGVYLRSMNLDGYPPHVDEFAHFMRALNWLEGIPPFDTRAFITVTLPITMLFKYFGVDVAAARMIIATLNMLAIIPLYAFTRGFGKGTAFIAVVLFVFSPSIIAMAQIVRDYSIAALFIYLTFFLTTKAISTQISGKLRIWLAKNWMILILLVILMAYALYDQASISAVIIGNVLVFAFIMVLKMLIEYQGSRIKNIALVGILLLVGITVTLFANKLHFNALHPTPLYFQIMTSGKYQNWSYLLPQLGWVFIVHSVYLLVSGFRSFREPKSQQVVNITLTFLGLMIFSALFLFAGKIAIRDRYYVVFVYYLIPIVAILFSKIIGNIQQRARKHQLFASVLVVPILLLFVINVPAIAYTNSYVGGENIITGSPHYIYADAYEYIKQNFKDGDVIITDKIGNYDRLLDNYFDPEVIRNIKILEATDKDLDGELSKFDQGWIAISENREPSDAGLAFDDQETEHFTLKFFGSFHGHVNLWYFKKH